MLRRGERASFSPGWPGISGTAARDFPLKDGYLQNQNGDGTSTGRPCPRDA